MARWWVNLKGEELDLEELTTLLHKPDRRIRKEEGRYFLTADRLDKLGTAQEVRDAAEDMIQSLNGFMRLLFHIRTPISVGNLEERGENDQFRNLFTMPESEPLFLREGAVVVEITQEGTNKPIPRQENPLRLWHSLTDSDQKVAQVAKLYGRMLQPWKDLFPIFEIIREDVGGEDELVSKGWTNKTEIRRFRHTANSPEAAGEGARHGVPTGNPPANPMTESEATSFIESLLSQWLMVKQGHDAR